MLKPLLLLLIIIGAFQTVSAQKKYINRKVAQKNYEGYLLMEEQKYDSALVLFNQAISDDSKAFFIYQNRAICKLHLKDTLGAINDYKVNIKLEPTNAETKYALGNIYKHQKDSVNALKFFIPAIEQANEEFSQKKLLYMNNFIGHYYRLNEQFDSALVFYNRVKIYTPQNSSVYINSAVCNFGLDSLKRFCEDLEQAFVLGGNVNCIALNAYCNGCNHLLAERGNTDTLSTALDTRLAGIIPDTIYHQAFARNSAPIPEEIANKKVKVYFNEEWQICLPDDASYYRESFWSGYNNYFGGNFTDYYIDGKIYAEGRLDRRQVVGKLKTYYNNGKLKLNANFNKALPVGNWTYYNPDGKENFKVKFFFENFTLEILDESSEYAGINTGTGKFKILLEKWGKQKYELWGEYENEERSGSWVYLQNGKKIVTENYKNGKFKRGSVKTHFGSVALNESKIGANIFYPVYLTQIAALNFESEEAKNFYTFIESYHF